MKITLKAARVNARLTQKDAAHMLGISKDTLYNYEKGKSYPDVLVLKKIEKIYRVGYNELIFLNIYNDEIVKQ